MQKDGTAVIQVATKYFLKTLYDMKNILDKKAFKVLDRKRSTSMKNINLDRFYWEKCFRDGNFTIEDIRNTWPNQLITDLWAVGLSRPIAHLLIQMANNLPKEKRKKIKKEWVNICYDILKPICEKPKKLAINNSPYITYILKKN